jgi:anti-sigma regulatory factor (Ser/Thr protein kinase)
MSTADRIRRLCAGSRGYWLRVAVVCVAAALLVAALFAALGPTARIPVLLRHALVHAAIMAALCGGLVPMIRRGVAGAGPGVQWVVTIPSLFGIAGTGTLLACGVTGTMDTRQSFWRCVGDSLPINALLTMTIGAGMSLYEAQRSRLAAVTLELRTRELEHERDRKLALQARLASLESRLQPHFLFNTLNAISVLIQDDPDEAERMVERLAALLRFSLDAGARGLVPLADELKIVTDYLEIEQARLGPRLSYALDVRPDAAACEVPPLAVQTLVENSVKHAIAPRPAGGRIRVTASVEGDRLVLGVWDDGPGLAPAAMRPGHGLDSLQTRLGARFGAAGRVAIARSEGGTLATVTLPRVVS